MNLQTLPSGEKRLSAVQASSALPARLLAALLFGLLGTGVCRYTFLSPGESAALLLLLKGGAAAAGEGVVMSLLGKLFASFALGATAGSVFSFEIPENHLQKARGFAFGAFLFIFTAALFIPVMGGDYIWDDDNEVTANVTLRSNSGLWEIWTGGITTPGKGEGEPGFIVRTLRPPLQKLERALWGEEFVAHVSSDYFPLKSTFLWLQYRLFGQEPSGYHVTNILVHALNTVLLWGLFRQLRVPGAWLGALLFGLHPVHVSSVAWISEGKNTWSLLFLILATASWLRYRDAYSKQQPAWGRYSAALLLYTASLLCKTSPIMFPFVLLLLVWWREGAAASKTVQNWRALLLQVAPFFLISLLLGLITIWFQNTRAIGGEEIPIGNFWSRLGGAGLAHWWYWGKALVPINLTTIYPRWPIDPVQAHQLFVAALVPLCAVVLWCLRQRIGRTPLFVYTFFFLMLLPVLGFFRMSYMRLTLVADHFQYLSNIAVVASIGAVATLALRRAPRGAAFGLLCGSGVALLAATSAYTWHRAAVHYNEETLWTDALKHNWKSWQSHNHLGAVYYSRYAATPSDTASLERAHTHFAKAAELNPDNPEVHNNHALTLERVGEPRAALAAFKRSLEIDAALPAVRRNYAEALIRLERYVEALEQYRTLLESGAVSEPVLMGFGKALFETGRLKGALAIYRDVARVNPQNRGALDNVRLIEARIEELRRTGQWKEEE